jgi:GNAT superfamily N-acetyltransferase
MTTVRIIRPQPGLSSADAASIFKLVTCIWPPAPGAPARRPEEVLAKWREQSSTHFVVGDDEILAHALIFQREIITWQGPMNVGALASVCVHPDYRGRGWGIDVARAAFDYLPELGVEVSLFQTGVPRFYEKLGARLITNPIFDGTRTDGFRGDPFRDDYKMIYPAAFAWPLGDIDLNGPGY